MTEPTFDFHHLQPDTMLDALQAFGVRVDSGLTALNSYENRVYLFTDEQKRRLVVKFYRPQRWSSAQILEEHQFALELQQQAFPIAAPISIDGQTLFDYQGFRFALYLSTGGRGYQADNLDQLETTGRYLALLHQTGRRRLFTWRPTIGIDEYLLAPRLVFTQSPLIPAALKQPLLQAIEALIADVITIWRADFQPLRLHGDCHAGNILWRDAPLFVDLDDARNGPAVQDFWMLLCGDKNEQQQQLSVLLEAYEDVMSFNLSEITLIEPLRAMRLVYYLAWLMRRWTDPAFPHNFPWLKEESYWQQQITAFSAQREALHQPPIRLTPMY